MTSGMIAVSIISHGHGQMVEDLVKSLLDCQQVSRILVTINLPEYLQLPQDIRLNVLRNPQPMGFGANHNAAFRLCRETYFCVVNPDIELVGNPFTELLAEMDRTQCALVAPLVSSPQGHLEDSIRYFPTLISLARKLLGAGDGRYLVTPGQASFCPEWVAGMFMLFRTQDFLQLGGFDENYFLYYEDVDICARVWKSGLRIFACPRASVIHDARRDSHRSMRHLRWHLASMGRYFAKHAGRLPSVA